MHSPLALAAIFFLVFQCNAGAAVKKKVLLHCTTGQLGTSEQNSLEVIETAGNILIRSSYNVNQWLGAEAHTDRAEAEGDGYAILTYGNTKTGNANEILLPETKAISRTAEKLVLQINSEPNGYYQGSTITFQILKDKEGFQQLEMTTTNATIEKNLFESIATNAVMKNKEKNIIFNTREYLGGNSGCTIAK